MLESLGYAEAPDARRGGPDPLQHVLDPRGGRQPLRRPPRAGQARSSASDPELVIGVGGCWAQSVKDEVFEQFPFVDVAFGPGQVHKLAEFLTSDSLTAQGFFEFEGFTGHLPAQARARRSRAGCRSASAATAAARTASCPRRAGARSPAAGGARRARSERWPPTACARSRCWARTSTPTAATCAPASAGDVRRAAARRSTRRRASSASATRARTRKDMREDVVRAHAELPTRLRAHPPAAAVGLVARSSRRCAAPTRASATSTASR